MRSNSILREKIHIQNVEISEKDQLIVHTQDGQRILFALNRFEAQLAKWHQVMQYGHRIGRRLSFLDLTIQNNMLLSGRPRKAFRQKTDIID